MLRWRYLKSSFALWFGLIWAGVGTPFFFIALFTFLDQRHFNSHAINTTATIVEKGHSTSNKGDSKYWMRYLYHDTAGNEHADVADVKWESWRKYSDGDELAISYLNDNPGRSHVNATDGEPVWILPLAFGGAGSLVGSVGWFLVVSSFLRAGRRARLIRTGTPVLGTVTGIDVNANVRINGRNPLYLKYEFKDDSSMNREGRSPDLPRRMESRWAPGDHILVLCDPFDSSRFEVDLFDQRPQDLDMLRARSA